MKKLSFQFNAAARKSAASQLIRLAWLSPGMSLALGVVRPIIAFALMVGAWLVVQIGAHVILSLEESKTDAPEKPDRKSVEPKPASLGHVDSVPAVKKRIAAKSGKRLTGDGHIV